MAVNVFIIHQLEFFLNDIVPLCLYHYSCGVDFGILIELEQLLKLYSYSFVFVVTVNKP